MRRGGRRRSDASQRGKVPGHTRPATVAHHPPLGGACLGRRPRRASAASAAVELTAITNSLQSTTFRSFEFYFVATGLYLAMALGFRAGLSAIYWAVFERGRVA